MTQQSQDMNSWRRPRWHGRCQLYRHPLLPERQTPRGLNEGPATQRRHPERRRGQNGPWLPALNHRRSCGHVTVMGSLVVDGWCGESSSYDSYDSYVWTATSYQGELTPRWAVATAWFQSWQSLCPSSLTNDLDRAVDPDWLHANEVIMNRKKTHAMERSFIFWTDGCTALESGERFKESKPEKGGTKARGVRKRYERRSEDRGRQSRYGRGGARGTRTSLCFSLRRAKLKGLLFQTTMSTRAYPIFGPIMVPHRSPTVREST